MEDFNDALIASIKALGGSKVVGPLLWPEHSIAAAQRTLLDALNPDRPTKLSPEQVVLILSKARALGDHSTMAWLCEKIGYAPPVPMAQEDEAAELQRSFIAATADMAHMLDRFQAMGMTPKQTAGTQSNSLRSVG